MNPPGRRFFEWLVLFALAVMILFLRVPTFDESFCDPDQGEPTYAAKLMLRGYCPYADGHITKPAGSIMIYTLTYGLFRPEIILIQVVAALQAIGIMLALFLIGQRQVNTWAGLWAAGLYTLYNVDLSASGACANYETWTLLPAVAALGFAMEKRLTAPKILAAGAMACLSVWMKQNAALFAVATTITIAWNYTRQREDGRVPRAMPALGWYSLGVALPMAIMIGAMASVDCAGAMFDVLNPLRLRTYLGSFDPQHRAILGWQQFLHFLDSNFFLFILVMLSLLTGPIVVRTPSARLRFASAALFFLSSIGFVFVGGRFYGHYFVVLFPFLCLLVGLVAGWVVWRILHDRRRLAIALVFTLGLSVLAVRDSLPELKLAAMSSRHWVAHRTPVSKKIFRANRSLKIEPKYVSYMLIQLEWQLSYQNVADHLREHLRPGDTIFVYDYIPELYHYTDTFAPTRHNENFEIATAASNPYYGLWFDRENPIVRANRTQALRQLRENPPRYIVRYAYDCTYPTEYYDFLSPTWPRNVFGMRMTSCLPKVVAWDDLARFIDQNYELIDIPTDNTLDVFELR